MSIYKENATAFASLPWNLKKALINLELVYERASSKTAATHDGKDNSKQSVKIFIVNLI